MARQPKSDGLIRVAITRQHDFSPTYLVNFLVQGVVGFQKGIQKGQGSPGKEQRRSVTSRATRAHLDSLEDDDARNYDLTRVDIPRCYTEVS